MRIILEYKIFDILKSENNVKFLDKVKKDNPNLYTKFLNILINKGLDIAKQKYIEFEPEEIKKRKLIDKEKLKKENDQMLLDSISDDINKIKNILYNSELKNIKTYIFKKPNIENFFKKNKIKPSYQNLFNKLLKTPKTLISKLNRRFKIDVIKFSNSYEKINYITIEQFNDNTFDLNFNFRFNLNFIEELNDTKVDFYIETKKLIWELGFKKDFFTSNDIYEKIDKLDYYLSDEYYEEFKIKKDGDIYNL